jgi:hypothetical protein
MPIRIRVSDPHWFGADPDAVFFSDCGFLLTLLQFCYLEGLLIFSFHEKNVKKDFFTNIF